MAGTVTPPAAVLETQTEADLNDQRHVFALTDEGRADGNQRVANFLQGIVKHENKIGNKVVVQEGHVFFIPWSKCKEG